jgi:hypothetical protein
MHRLALLSLIAVFAAAPVLAAPAPLPTGGFVAAGRTVTVSLPYRAADGLVWASATRMSELGPFAFKGLALKPKAGPAGTDLSVFTYEAGAAGTATLKFGLVPPGQMLVGPPTMTYRGVPASTFEAKVSVR